MTKSPALTAAQYKKINQKIADRRNVFYWQTDRAIGQEDAALVWGDRHAYFSDAAIITAVNAMLDGEQIVRLIPLDPDAQTSLGNVNSVRCAVLASGKEIIIRCHPRGVRNGYFYAEALASQKALSAGLPAYHTLAIHEAVDDTDFAFQVCEKMPGTALVHWLAKHPADEAALLVEVGKCLAQLHAITVPGFGPFDNQKAKQGVLKGLHPTYADAVRAGLAFNLEVLTERNIITTAQAKAINKLMGADNPLLDCKQAVIVHNDFADWNMLTDGTHITGMLDWDECVAGDPVADIACWSTFFDPSRLDGMLKGYWKVAKKPADFAEKFELLRLRYTVSKMTLRVRRYEREPLESIREKIEFGKKHLADSFQYFEIS